MDSGIITDSVLFFDNNMVVKEMLYPEFEAILDHVVGIQEFRNKAVPAVFVRINAHLQAVATVFFYIHFDENGYAEKNWNLPLSHLADKAGRGPDMGAGAIKLSCRSQCSVSWHQRSLWDPDMETGKTFEQIASVLKRNRLGLECAPQVDPPMLEPVTKPRAWVDKPVDKTTEKDQRAAFAQELEARLSAQAQEYKLRIATMKSEACDHLEKLHANYRKQLSRVHESLKLSKQESAEEKHKNQQLKATLDKQAETFRHDRERYQRALSEKQGVQTTELTALQEKFEREQQASIDKATAELKERLDMREVELFYRDEQIGRLHEDIIALRKENQALVNASGDRLLKKLVESGITFVAYHPGVDQLPIPVRDMARYLESPLKYVAEKCTVDLNLYQQWQAHYELPVCNHTFDDGSICGVPVPKIEKPVHFIVGESDCCAKHNYSADLLDESIDLTETSQAFLMDQQ